MSSGLCFICHDIVYSATNEEFRDKYRELIGMILYPDSYLCRVCCHLVEKFWYFKSVCLKRNLEYPVLFGERGIINLQSSEIVTNALCIETECNESNNCIYIVDKSNDFNNDYDIYNDFTQLPEVKNEFDGNNDDINEPTAFNDDVKVDSENEVNEAANFNEESISNGDNDDFTSIDNNDFNDEEMLSNGGEKVENWDVKSVDIDVTVKKRKTKSKKKRQFDRVILSLEEQKQDLERSRREKKYVEAEFKCYNCALGFLFKDTYQAHMMRHEESNGEYRCDTCSLRFATPAVRRSHCALHRERYICRRCSATLRPRARASHAAQCYGTPADETACHKCPRLFKDASGLQQHLKRYHQVSSSTRTYACSICGKSCGTQAAVRTHMIKHIQRKFPCETCNATFSSPYTLTQHKRKHAAPPSDGIVNYCVVCDKGFNTRKSLLAHMRNAKQHQNEQFECPICSRACANQRSLSYHIDSVHSTTKNYSCTRCNARYATSKALSRHVRGHDVKNDVKLAVCHLCGRSFKGNNKLVRHLKEVCEKEKLEEELSSYYAQDVV